MWFQFQPDTAYICSNVDKDIVSVDITSFKHKIDIVWLIMYYYLMI